MLFIRPVLN